MPDERDESECSCDIADRFVPGCDMHGAAEDEESE